jgi:hypothetical protein
MPTKNPPPPPKPEYTAKILALKVGQTILLDGEAASIQPIITRIKRRNRHRCQYQSQQQMGGVRVWRIA